MEDEQYGRYINQFDQNFKAIIRKIEKIKKFDQTKKLRAI